MSTEVVTLAIDSKSEARLDVLSGKIKSRMKRTAASAIQIGLWLIQAKKLLKHGKFGYWLEREFSWTHQTANLFMQVASRFGANGNMERLGPTVLYLLSAKSVSPDAAREAELLQAKGIKVTTSIAKSIAKRHRQNANVSSRPPIVTGLLTEVRRRLINGYPQTSERDKAVLGVDSAIQWASELEKLR